MAEAKMCPHCGSKMFAAAITKPCIVEVYDDNDNPFKILKEVDKNPEVEIAKCARCKAELTEADLVMGVACKECNKIVSPGELNADGICDVCEALKQRSELANASKEELIKMLLNAERNANPVANKIKEKVSEAEEVVQQLEEDAQSGEPKKKTRTKARAKKDVDATPVETPTEASETQVEQAVDDLANSQEAPFPEMNAPEIPEPVVETPPVVEPASLPSEQAIGAGFEMFPSDEAF